MIRRPPRSTLFPYTNALPISAHRVGHLPGRGPANLDLTTRRRRDTWPGALSDGPRGPVYPPAVQGPPGHHRHPRDGGAVRRGQADRRPGPQDPAVSLAADVRRGGVHGHAGTVRQARRHDQELQGGRRGQARRPARAGLLHGRRRRRGDRQGQEAPRGGIVAERLTLELATPTRLVVAETADEVVVPGIEGYFGVLPGHAAFLTTL